MPPQNLPQEEEAVQVQTITKTRFGVSVAIGVVVGFAAWLVPSLLFPNGIKKTTVNVNATPPATTTSVTCNDTTVTLPTYIQKIVPTAQIVCSPSATANTSNGSANSVVVASTAKTITVTKEIPITSLTTRESLLSDLRTTLINAGFSSADVASDLASPTLVQGMPVLDPDLGTLAQLEQKIIENAKTKTTAELADIASDDAKEADFVAQAVNQLKTANALNGTLLNVSGGGNNSGTVPTPSTANTTNSVVLGNTNLGENLNEPPHGLCAACGGGSGAFCALGACISGRVNIKWNFYDVGQSHLESWRVTFTWHFS